MKIRCATKKTEAFSTTFTYDNRGRPGTITHPSGIVETNVYNTYGYLSSITAGGASWTITGMNERMQPTGTTMGSSLIGEYAYNSYGYPASRKARVGTAYRQDYHTAFNATTANPISRQDYLRSKSESFTFDTGLNRLTSVSGPQNLTMQYATNGNITLKSDLGTSQLFTYSGTKPYQLTGLETNAGLVSDVEQNIAYTSFEQPSSITEGVNLASFLYNPDGQRAKMEVKLNGSTTLTRWYAGSSYVKETAGANTKQYTWIGGDAYSAPCLGITQNGTTTYYYLLRDHLGTTTHVTDASGTVVNEYSFDSWGRRRNVTDWGYTIASQTDLLPDRGFTGHEYLPQFKLYNMNRRMYNPVLARFLSPDNYVGSANSSQAYNRYSYCGNNPLSYTDPDGEWIQFVIGGLIGGISGYKIADANGIKGWDKLWYTLGGVAIGAATAGVGTAVSVSAGVVYGGIAGGAVSGYGFGLMGGSAAGLRGGELFGSGINGMWQGALTGLAGGSVGGAIGGGWGALAGGATAGGLGTWMSGGSGEDVLKGAALGGVMGWGVYHASLAYSYYASGIKSTKSNYNQYAKWMRLTQRSIFWNREGRFIPNSNGGINVSKLGSENNVTVDGNQYSDALFDYHTHQEFGYDHFSNIQDAIAAHTNIQETDLSLRQNLTYFAKNGEINQMTLYLGTREGNIHYWTNSGVEGKLNYNFSSIFSPFNIMWSTSLIH